jgi:hypothetical protein
LGPSADYQVAAEERRYRLSTPLLMAYHFMEKYCALCRVRYNKIQDLRPAINCHEADQQVAGYLTLIFIVADRKVRHSTPQIHKIY